MEQCGYHTFGVSSSYRYTHRSGWVAIFGLVGYWYE